MLNNNGFEIKTVSEENEWYTSAQRGSLPAKFQIFHLIPIHMFFFDVVPHSLLPWHQMISYENQT